MWLGNADVRRLVERAFASTNPCRVRLTLRTSVRELHDLRWESLFPPRKMYFSREVGGEIPLVPLDRSRALRVVVAMASPAEARGSELSVVGATQGLDALRSLAGGSATIRTVDQPLTLARLVNELESPCELFYLACPVDTLNGQAFLFLAEDPGRRTDLVEGAEFASLLRKLPARPRVVFLAADDSALLGPLLVEAGVPAVVVFHTAVTPSSLNYFTAAFFRELLAHGEPDRAAASGRESLRSAGRPDWWTPLLFAARGGVRLW
jgi:hypothetical protein